MTLATLGLLSACTSGSIVNPGPVQVVVPKPPSPAAAAACRRLIAALPPSIEHLASRTTTPVSPLVHAWGSPNVVLQCGIRDTVKSLSIKESSVAISATNGSSKVLWWEAQLPTNHPVVNVLTALFATTGISVTVPTSYDQGYDSPILLDLDPLLIRKLGADRG